MMQKVFNKTHKNFIPHPANHFFKAALLFGCLMIGCQQNPIPFSKKIMDADPIAKNFETANQLKYTQDYEQAAKQYATELSATNLSISDSLYLINQLIYCQVIINQTKGLEEQLQVAEQLIARLSPISTALIGDYLFNKGRYLFLQKKSDEALSYTHRALQYFYQAYPSGHLKIAQGLTLLSLVHLKDGTVTDSVHYYSLQANHLFLRHPELKAYDWENNYVLGFTSLIDRAHERGAYYSQAALQKLKNLPFKNRWLEARSTKLLANLLKKQADALKEEKPILLKKNRLNLHRTLYALTKENPISLETNKLKMYQTADSLFQKAISIGNVYQDADLRGFYIDWMINSCRLSDSIYFFNTLNIAKERFKQHQEWIPYHNYLLGYYYYLKADIKKSQYHFDTFLKTIATNAEVDYRIFAATYNCLRNIHKRLNNFETATEYAKQSFLLYDCATSELNLSDLNATTFIDSTKRNCLTISGFFAEDLLQKYRIENKEKDLILANSFFDFVERYSFKSLLNKDEDAFLSFQAEAGRRIYGKAIEAAHEAWQQTQDPFWLSKIFSYMEYLKSYLLYRDMLKKDISDTHSYSLTDSIRIMQGEVNQLLFSLNKEGVLANDDLTNNNLVHQLSQLENRRSQRLDSFELKIHQRSLNLTDVQQQLGAQKGLVNYLITHQHLFGLYIDQDTILLFEQVIEGSRLNRMLLDFQQSIAEEVRLDAANIAKYLTSARDLYQLLIQPFEHRLSNIEQLVFIPDQALDGIPFEALLSQDIPPNDVNFRTLPYLLHQTKIVYTSSWKVFNNNQQHIAQNFQNKSIGFWTTPTLEATNGLEVIEQAVQAGFKNNYQIFSQEKNGKKLFMQQHPQFDILHLLLHARSSQTNRYDNQIRFGSQPQDVLYGFDLYKEAFSAQLLVLASCESAIGVAQIGEGTFSLARSFINSGVPEVVAAQFLIPQTTTAPLLSQFYQNLKAGNNAATALHHAKISYLKNVSKERHAYPRFWAGMVLFN